MSDPTIQSDAQSTLRLPPRGDLVEQTLSRFETVKVRSRVIDELSKPDLVDVGLWLTEPGKSVMDAWRVLHESLGGEIDSKGQLIDPFIARNTFYRYAEAFLDLYHQIKSEYAQRIARLNVAEATDSNIRSMTLVARNRLTELVAEKLVTADDADQVEISKLAAVVAESERAQHNADKLELDRQNLERSVRETEAKLELADKRVALLQQDIDRREREIQESIDEAKKTVQTKAKAGSKTMSADDVIAILDKVMKGEAA